MKTNLLSLILAIVLVWLHTACSVTIPMMGGVQKQHNSAQTVSNPYLQKKTGDKRPILTGIGVAAGAGLFYYAGKSTVVDPNGVPYTAAQVNQNSYKGLAVGTLAGLLFVGGMIAYNNNTNKWLRPKTTDIRVTDSNFDTWLTAYNKKNNPNFIKYRQEGSKYLLVPNSKVKAYQAEEDRLDDIAYNRVMNGEIGAYEDYMRNRLSYSKNYKTVLGMETEYMKFYRAMDSQLREGYSFNDMLLNCNDYMSAFPNGNKNFQAKVSQRLQDIKAIPISIRQEKEAEIAQKVQEARRQERAKVNFFIDILSLFFNSTGGTSTEYKTQCAYCFGRGKILHYENNVVVWTSICSNCNGTGNHD